MGLRMHVADPADRLWTLNTPRVPEGVDDAKVRQWLLEKRGIEIAGGFGPLAGKVFRIGLMGYGSTAENVLTGAGSPRLGPAPRWISPIEGRYPVACSSGFS